VDGQNAAAKAPSGTGQVGVVDSHQVAASVEVRDLLSPGGRPPSAERLIDDGSSEDVGSSGRPTDPRWHGPGGSIRGIPAARACQSTPRLPAVGPVSARTLNALHPKFALEHKPPSANARFWVYGLVDACVL
jgi:hypothetical protein